MNNYKELDFYNNNFNKDDLYLIKENIQNFIDFIKDYKNILLICSDFPNYGGAATNCFNIQQFINQNHNTFSIYYSNDNIIEIESFNNLNIKFVLKNDLYSYLFKLDFEPDIIILKSFVDFNLKDIFNCKIIYLIPGIFKDNLNTYYYKLEQNNIPKFINKSVIEQIKKSDYNYCNSAHTKYLLKEYFKLDTKLFYSSFISFFNKYIYNDENFNLRKYDYGLIMSNFERPIKNVMKSILFLKNKKNVILIGKNSNKFSSYGFKTIDLIDNNKLLNYYKKIKCVIQDSFYESCSNVLVESIFNGCKNNIFITFITNYDTEKLNIFYNTLFYDWNVYLKIFVKTQNNNLGIINSKELILNKNINTKEKFIDYYLKHFGTIIYIDSNANLTAIKNLNINFKEDFICIDDKNIVFFNLNFNPFTNNNNVNNKYKYVKSYNI